MVDLDAAAAPAWADLPGAAGQRLVQLHPAPRLGQKGHHPSKEENKSVWKENGWNKYKELTEKYSNSIMKVVED